MGRSVLDNFKKRFGEPAKIELRYAKAKTPPSEDAYRSAQISKAYAEVLKGVLGREPTQDEIFGEANLRIV